LGIEKGMEKSVKGNEGPLEVLKCVKPYTICSGITLGGRE